MKFKARYSIEQEKEVEAESLQAAVEIVKSGLAKSGLKTKILGVVLSGQPWPDGNEPSAHPRPPRNTPPSGSPGTPTSAPATHTTAVAA